MSAFTYNAQETPYGFRASKEDVGSYGSMQQTMNRGALTGWRSRGYQMFNEDHVLGRREKGAMTGASLIQADRRSGFSETLAGFQAETSRFNRDFEESETMRVAMDSKFAAADANMQAMLEGLDKAPSRASSVGQYQMLAKNSMQETQQALNKLSGMKAPDLIDMPTTFKDPFTGEDVELGTKFADIYQADDPTQMANQIVDRKFKQATSRRVAELQSESRKELGKAYDFSDDLGGQVQQIAASFKQVDTTRYSPALHSQHHLQALSAQALNTAESLRKEGANDLADQVESLQYVRMGINGIRHSAARDTIAALDAQSKGLKAKKNIQEFAEAGALAEMSGMRENLSFKDNSGNRQYLDPTEYFIGADKNKELSKMKEYTASKLALEFRAEGASFESEFNNRVQRAEAEVEAGIRNKELNAIRSGSIDAQKRQLQERLANQQNEYASTLAGLASGGGQSGDAGIIMSDTRPS